MKVTEIMKTAYLCFDSGDSVYEVLMKLDAKGLRGAPVVQRGKYLGMITLSGIAYGRAGSSADPRIGSSKAFSWSTSGWCAR